MAFFKKQVDYATCLYLTTLNLWSSDHNVSIHDDRVKLSIYVITEEKLWFASPELH
jgi:hypothetical protein